MSYGKNSYKGRFKPKNPEKYNGNAENIVFRSSWELRCMKYFDDHPGIIWWSSEEMHIPYYSPVDTECIDISQTSSLKCKEKMVQL